VKTIWTSRVAETAGKYAEHAPMSTVCCNACRTCATTNLVGLAFAAAAGVGVAVSAQAKRLLRRA